ncbi:hypothetical protein B0H13DRAFT_2673865 [Mycena leptocephala]|nr:hypothetical protein B0H13DRAFT_2673865 [Mycena leptocephala]
MGISSNLKSSQHSDFWTFSEREQTWPTREQIAEHCYDAILLEMWCPVDDSAGTYLDPPSTNPLLDLTQLLTSNDVPIDSDVPVIQISSLKTCGATSKARREGGNVRQHRAIISPVRRVPHELICEIFALTLSSGMLDDEDRALQPPWYLGHICRSWRHAAVSFCPLWSSITIPPSLSSSDSRLLPAIEAQLLRTANASLDMGWSDVQDDINPRLLDIVFPHCSRWRSLRIQVTALYEDRQLSWLHPVRGHLDRLEKLEVISTRDTFIPDVFSNAPKLREVILTGEVLYPHRFSPTSIVIPWEHITHYRGAYPAARHLEILRAAPNLLECVVGIIDFVDFHPDVDPTVIIPRLRRLCVEEDRFLLHLTAPLLEELSSEWFEPPSLLSFVQRSSCTLKKLALIRCRIPDDIVTVLRNIPSITDLLLVMEYSENEDNEDTFGQEQIDLFSAMHISGTPADICPNLTSFRATQPKAIHWRYCAAHGYLARASTPERWTERQAGPRVERVRVRVRMEGTPPHVDARVLGSGTRTREALAVRVHPAHKPQDIHARIRVPGAIDTIQLHRFHCRPPRRYACTAPHRTDLHTAGATLHTQPKRGWPSTPTDATHPDPHIHIAPLAGVVAQRSLCHSRRPHRDAHNRAAAAHIQPHPRGSTSKGTAALSAIQTHKAHLPCEVFVRADKNIADLRTHRSTPASAHAHPPPPYPDDPPVGRYVPGKDRGGWRLLGA